jgi:hypothetical protein
LETENNQEEVTIEDPKAVLAALDRAKSDAKKFREEKEQLEVDLNSKDMKIAEYSGKLLHEKVLQKISAEGVKDPRRLLRFMDMTKFEFDENLDVVGFEDQFGKLKEDLPEIFDPKLRVGGQADSGITSAVNTKISATQLQAAKILGKL